MLLTITRSSDQTVGEVTQYVDKPTLRLNIDADPMLPMSYTWNGKSFNCKLEEVDLSQVTAVWYRIGHLMYLKERAGTFDMLNRLCREEMVYYLYSPLRHAVWVSDFYNMRKADNKQLQLETASSLGMFIPHTLVTSSAMSVAEFRAKLRGNMVVKPLAKQIVKDGSKVRALFTSRVSPDANIDMTLLSSSPAIFQEEIEREFDVRTIVVEDRVFSMSIRQVGSKTGDVDYRYGPSGNLVFERHMLPADLSWKCVELVKSFGLKYSAMDFILAKDGTYYFLESNPCGAWLFVQRGCDYEISKAIAEMLSR